MVDDTWNETKAEIGDFIKNRKQKKNGEDVEEKKWKIENLLKEKKSRIDCAAKNFSIPNKARGAKIARSMTEKLIIMKKNRQK